MVFINLPQNANYSKTSKKLEHVWLNLKVNKKKKLSSVLSASFVEVRSNALLNYQAHNINLIIVVQVVWSLISQTCGQSFQFHILLV